MLMHDLYRCQLIEFGVKVLGLEGETPFHHTGFVFRAPRDGAARKALATAIKGFQHICETRELDPFECTSSILNFICFLYLKLENLALSLIVFSKMVIRGSIFLYRFF
jgi:hypothetical protein